MRLLADENVPRPIFEWLQSQGHDVLLAGEVAAGESDTHWLTVAENDQRMILTAEYPAPAIGGGSRPRHVASGQRHARTGAQERLPRPVRAGGKAGRVIRGGCGRVNCRGLRSTHRFDCPANGGDQRAKMARVIFILKKTERHFRSVASLGSSGFDGGFVLVLSIAVLVLVLETLLGYSIGSLYQSSEHRHDPF